MTESQRTAAFAGIAAASLAVALLASPSAPKPSKEFQQVGEEFYPKFTDPSAAKQLQVIAYNADTAEARIFGVQYEDGKWRIPSRHNYPADGKDRLAKCAASIIGLKREAVAGQREAEYAEFEVVDPLDENSNSLKRGQRITLKDEAGAVLSDYIIGKQVPNRSGHFYIRRPDEKVTYTAKISLDLSTKFADWIEPDLLKIDSFKLTGVTVDNYSIDLKKGEIDKNDVSLLTRKNSSDPWKLAGMDEATEEVNAEEVRKLVDGLDNMKIVGVRPKPLKLQRDLKLDQGIAVDQLTAMDLESKGYFFARTPDGNRKLVSKEGELDAMTDQGVQYTLQFGEVFSGTEEELEFGFTKKEEEKKDGEQPDAKPSDSLKKSRYLFVTVHLDPELLGPKPEEPQQPEPIGEAPAEAAAAPTREADSAADAVVPDNVGPAAEYAFKKREYDAAVAKFDGDKTKYNTDIKAYEEKLKAGEKQVKELNARFADWYYVISADAFENLRQGRKTLVKPKSAAAPANPAGAGFPQ
jgi:hypothetical protein